MDDEQYNESNLLIERFRKSLSLPLSERYFDEDELIDIFDNAGDLEDDFLRFEVLSVASRFHPDSEPLNRRRCLLYGIVSESAGAQYLEINARDDNPMWQIMTLRQKRGESDINFAKELDLILASIDCFDEEETAIQLIRLVAELNQHEWLTDNLEELIRRTRNEKVVLFEAASAFEAMHLYDVAVRLLVRLTDIDPFGFSNWLMLAEQYLMIKDDEGFNNAIEYALALEPDSWQALFVKARHTLSLEDYATTIELCEKCLRAHPPVSDPYRLLSYALKFSQRDHEAEGVCRTALELFPAEVLTLIPELLVYNPFDTAQLLDLFYRNNPDNSEPFWRAWINRLAEMGHWAAAAAAAECFRSNSGLFPITIYPAEYWFRERIKLEDTLEWLNTYAEESKEAGESVDEGMFTILYSATLARLDRFPEAIGVCNDYLRYYHENPYLSWSKILAARQARSIITLLRSSYDSDRNPKSYLSFIKFGLI